MNYIEIVIGVIIVVLSGFIALQFNSFQRWLLYAVSEAERFLGSGTGQLKLQYVYNLAVNSKFGLISKLITFKMFSKFVDAALVKLEIMIKNSDAIAKFLNKKVIDVDEIIQLNK